MKTARVLTILVAMSLGATIAAAATGSTTDSATDTTSGATTVTKKSLLRAKAKRQMLAQNVAAADGTDATGVNASSSVHSPQSSPSADAASLSGKLITGVKPAAPSKWVAEAYAEDYYTVSDAKNGQGQMATAEFLGVTYKFSPDLKVYLHQNFVSDIDVARQDNAAYKGSDLRFDDTEVALGVNKVLTWGRDGSLNLLNRVYAPTGEYSIRGGRIGRFREIMTFSQPVNAHLEVGHTTDYRFTANSEDGFTDNFGHPVANQDMGGYQYVYATAKANDMFSSTACLGTLDKWVRAYHAADGTPTAAGHTTRDMYVDLSVSAQVTKLLGLTLGTENDMNIGTNQTQRPGLFRGDETYYYFNMYATL